MSPESTTTRNAGPAYRPLRRIITWRVLGALAIALTILLSLVPMPKPPVHIEHSDKLEHFLTYFALTAWYVQLVANRRALAWHAAGLALLGAAIEIAQGFTTWRLPDWWDLGANLLGVAAGSLVYATPLRNVLARFDGLRPDPPHPL
jgi:VanZ family protein